MDFLVYPGRHCVVQVAPGLFLRSATKWS